jgi:hypothetical protein
MKGGIGFSASFYCMSHAAGRKEIAPGEPDGAPGFHHVCPFLRAGMLNGAQFAS